MAFKVEDGTGTGNSYCSVSDADAYHLLLGNDDWVGQNAEKEAALMRATSVIDMLYGPRMISHKLLTTQNLQYPKYSYYNNYLVLITAGSIPQALKNATAEAALLVMRGVELFPEPNQANNTKRQKDKVGDLETESEYFGPADNSTFENYRKVELHLYELLMKKHKTVNLVR